MYCDWYDLVFRISKSDDYSGKTDVEYQSQYISSLYFNYLLVKTSRHPSLLNRESPDH